MQLSVGHQRSAEGDASDVGAQVGHGLQDTSCRVSFQVRELNHVLGDAGEHGRESHQAVEGCHQLWQVRDFNTLGDGEACGRDVTSVNYYCI